MGFPSLEQPGSMGRKEKQAASCVQTPLVFLPLPPPGLQRHPSSGQINKAANSHIKGQGCQRSGMSEVRDGGVGQPGGEADV